MQRVVQQLYPGKSWRSDAGLARAMFAAFRSLRDVHELRLLLHEAERLPLSADQAARREHLLARLEPREAFDASTLLALDVASLQRDVHVFLRSLAACAGDVRARRRLPLLR